MNASTILDRTLPKTKGSMSGCQLTAIGPKALRGRRARRWKERGRGKPKAIRTSHVTIMPPTDLPQRNPAHRTLASPHPSQLRLLNQQPKNPPNIAALVAMVRGRWPSIPDAHNVPTSSVMTAGQGHLRTPQGKGSDRSPDPSSHVHAPWRSPSPHKPHAQTRAIGNLLRACCGGRDVRKQLLY